MAQTSTPGSKNAHGEHEVKPGQGHEPTSTRHGNKGRPGPTSTKRDGANGKGAPGKGAEAPAAARSKHGKARGVEMPRHYTQAGRDPLDEVTWEKRTSIITNPDGSVVFKMTGAEIPAGWSQLATDIAVSKYFRKAGLHGRKELGETSVRQLVVRLARTLRESGERQTGYFATKADADAFESELSYMLVHQIGAFNSPVWFNVGLYHRYEIEGSGGNFAWDATSDTIAETRNSYERPQGSACMPYDVPVNTTEGLIPIGEIVERFRVDPGTQLSTYDREGNPTRIVAAICNGKRYVMEFALNDGTTLRMTSDHIVFAADKNGVVREKPAGDLEIGEESLVLSRVALLPAEREVRVGAFRVTPDLAWLAGMMVGDGFCGRPSSATSDIWEIKVNTAAERARVEAIAERHGLPFTTLTFHWGFTVRGYGSGGRTFWERLGLWSKTGAKEIPAWMFQAGQDLVGAFLGGLFDSDGTVSQCDNGRVRVQFANTSLNVIAGAHTLLRSLGIFCTQREFVDTRDDADRKDQLTLTVNDIRSVDLFAERVGFTHEGKKAELDARAPRREAAYRQDTVLVIGKRKVGSTLVFDIQTEASVFWANGLLVHNCFIQQVPDDLMGIYGAIQNEARLFKHGSGVGSNFSAIRGRQEKLSSGGTSSGLMSFLEVFDRAAGATKSGGTTRRAAKMVCLDMDHPEIKDFITWKITEEKKAHALIAAGYSSDFNGEAYHTVAGQNSNNSVRVSDDFLRAVERGDKWQTIARTTGEVVETFEARELWDTVAEAAWGCADPGVQYDTTINTWHTCPNTDRIFASNPCVTGDTLVATVEGLRRIDSLLEAPTQVVGADGELHPIAPAFPTGTKPVYRLRTRAGFELSLTADHRVFTRNRGDVPACELTRDDVVVLGRPTFGRRSVDSRLAEFLGLMVGDGCIAGAQETALLTLSSEEEALAQGVHARLSAYRRDTAADGRAMRETEVRPIERVEVDALGTLSSVPSSLRINTSARCVIDELRPLAVLDRGSEHKAFLPAAFELDQPTMAAVLRGLFTADGTVANYGDKSQYVGLDSVALPLLQQVQQMLLGFGIKAKLYRDRRVAGQTMALLPDGKGGRREYPVQQIHSLRISRSSRVRFEEAIGFVAESGKVGQLRALNATVSAYEDRLEDRVESLTFLGEKPVFDLTEPVTSHFVANGLVVHNCSEFMFLDNTSCNLSSLNLLKFLKSDGSFDVGAYRHAARVFFIAQEILVDFASYPTQVIARNSHDYRPLGLGYANLGSLLMVLGIPYDSDQGRAWAAALTAILCGHAYKTSAEMAVTKGAFGGFAKNREPMLKVMRMHRDAAYTIHRELCPEDLWRSACQDWDDAVSLGEQHGYRNAQATVLAPTGTIGLLMDCDTTGVEPDFALVKFKKLAGGGYFKIVNQSVPEALRRLGYRPEQAQEIVAYISGTNTLLGAPHINRATLKDKGFLDEDLKKIEDALPGLFDLEGAFSPWVLGEESFRRLLGSSSQRSLLSALGFSRAQVDQASDVVVGRMTIEGAPYLRPEHVSVFDCANRCGKHGKRFLAPMSHIHMMAAVQPFLSGAISKTVNLPNDATVDEVRGIYEAGWKLGLKAVALYRDGCKASQPLSSSNQSDEGKAADKEADAAAAAASATEVVEINVPLPINQSNLAPVRPVGMRVRLPKKRSGFTQEARVGGHKIFLRTGEYADGSLGEIFIDMHKEGAAFRSVMNCLAMAVSVGLQYGVPLDTFVEQFTFTRFEPQGQVEGHPNIKLATSIVDYIFRVLGVEYLQRFDLAHVKPEPQIKDPNEGWSGGSGQIENNPVTVAPSSGQTRSATSLSEGVGGSALDQQLEDMMGDAPVCDVCGHITVRNGACYKCLNCGNSMGCS